MMKKITRAARYALPLGLLLSSASAHAFIQPLVDAITSSLNWLAILAGSGAVFTASMLMTVAVTVIPMLADITLVVCAMLMPICLAFWPVNKSWAMSAIGTGIGAVLIKAVVAFFLEIILGSGGALQAAINKTRSQMLVSIDAGRPAEFTLVVVSMLGITAVMIVMLLIVMQLPGIVRGIFGGFTPSADLGRAASTAKKIATGK